MSIAKIEKTAIDQIDALSSATTEKVAKLSSELEESEKNRLILDADNKGLRDVKLQVPSYC